MTPEKEIWGKSDRPMGAVSQVRTFSEALVDTLAENLEKEGTKFFVLKASDYLRALGPQGSLMFSQMLDCYREWRISKGKSPENKYWVVNRDEPYADAVKKIIEENEGVELK